MSVLFIGPYRQPDEWGQRSFNLLQSLKKTGGKYYLKAAFSCTLSSCDSRGRD